MNGGIQRTVYGSFHDAVKAVNEDEIFVVAAAAAAAVSIVVFLQHEKSIG